MIPINIRHPKTKEEIPLWKIYANKSLIEEVLHAIIGELQYNSKQIKFNNIYFKEK